MDDLISRQAAIEAIEDLDWYHQNKNKDMVLGANSDEHQAWYKADDIYKTLDVLPSAQQWIQVAEKLPEYTSDYAVTVGINYYGEGMHTEVRTALYNVVYHTWTVHETEKVIIGDVLAWMPLPEPYKEQNNG